MQLEVFSKQKNTLTKSEFITFLNSPVHLWALKNNKLQLNEPTQYEIFIQIQGYEVEDLAAKYLKQVLLPTYLKKNSSSSDSKILQFQPTVISDELQARTDFLFYNSEIEKHDIYEVKSSTKVSKENLYDAAFQKIVFENEFPINKVYILHVNEEYIKQGDLELESYFTAEDVTERVDEMVDEVQELINSALSTVKSPTHENLLACTKPKTCPCINLCHPNLPDYPIYDIARISDKKVYDLRSRGITDIKDIPESFQLSEKQRIQVQVAKIGSKHFNKDEVYKRLSKLQYPLYFLDYETYAPAIPIYDNYNPYQQIVFQYSLHVQDSKEGSGLEHYEFLHKEATDPSRPILESLSKNVGEKGSVIVWNKSFEMARNQELAELHPDYKDFLNSVNSRIFDLMDIFKDQLYVGPKFKGSYSIKKVLPVLVPELKYDDLDISNGSEAMIGWRDMVFGGLGDGERDEIFEGLLRYCEVDTLAMVEILRVLFSICG